MAVTALFLPRLCLKSPGASREEDREVGGGREVWEEPWRTISHFTIRLAAYLEGRMRVQDCRQGGVVT